MKLLKTTLIVLVLGGASLLSLSCVPRADSVAVSEDQVVTVGRGDLTIDIISSGNLVYSDKEELAFEVSGTVAEVLVKEGDSVDKGEVLAKLDVSEWQDQLSALQDKVTTAEKQVTAKQRELLQAELNLKNAEIALGKAQDSWLETLSGGPEVKRARDYLKYAEEQFAQATTTVEQEIWAKEVAYARKNLKAAEAKLNGLLSETEDVAVKRLTVELSQARLEDAQGALEDAQKAVEDAQEALDEARSINRQITAPFTGGITQVSIAEGDQAKKGKVALILADLTKFEADVLVNETEIFKIREGATATIQVDAISDISLPARVTSIAPTATIQAGVVNYKVNVVLEPLMPVPSVAPSEQRGMIEPSRERAGEGAGLGQRPGGVIRQALTLREGLTVTVNILVEERRDVLLIPNRAIIRRNNQTLVKVLENDVVSERAIKTGISDWQYTEVTEGLSEGEEVVITSTTSTSTTPTVPPSGGRFFFGGGGR